MSSDEEILEFENRSNEIRKQISSYWQFYMTYAFFVIGSIMLKDVDFKLEESAILACFHLTFAFMNIAALYPRYEQLTRMNILIINMKVMDNKKKFTSLVLDDLKRSLKKDVLMKNMVWLVHSGAAVMILYLFWR